MEIDQETYRLLRVMADAAERASRTVNMLLESPELIREREAMHKGAGAKGTFVGMLLGNTHDTLKQAQKEIERYMEGK